MRLIDADKLIKDIDYSADLGGALGKVVEVVKTYAKFMVQTAPTIKAIDESWVVAQIQQTSGAESSYYARLLHKWREENVGNE